MAISESSIQNQITAEIQSQQNNPDSNKLFIAIIISVLTTAIITGSVVYFWQKSAKERIVNDLEQKIASLRERTSMLPRVEPSPRPSKSLALSPTLTYIIPVASLTPTTTPSASWKMYTNTKYGYSINYPSEYRIGSCRVCFDLSTADFITLDPPQKDGYGGIMISHLRDRKSGESLEEYLEDISGVDANPVVQGSKNRFKLNGYEALVTVTKNYGYENKNVFVTNGGSVIHFRFSGVTSPSNKGISLADYKNLDIFNKILSTFRFSN